MATDESMAIRSDTAADRIEARLAELGVHTGPLPRTHRQREMLRCLQLERIADALDAIDIDRTLQEARDLLSGTWTKAEMEAVLTGVNDGNDGE